MARGIREHSTAGVSMSRTRQLTVSYSWIAKGRCLPQGARVGDGLFRSVGVDAWPGGRRPSA